MRFNFLRPKARVSVENASTAGRVVYAVGDIHGRLDLLDILLDLIVADAQALGQTPGARTPALAPALVFVGDYIDRGPESRGVIDRLIALKADFAERTGFEIRTLMGNHEQTLLAFLQSVEGGPAWFEFGGGETLASYGVTPPPARSGLEAWRDVQARFQHALPTAHLKFLRELELSALYGDYLFVHAGVRPGVALEQQDAEDLMWIRGDFLNQPHRLDKVVVHGHTPTEEPVIGKDRLGIDTGAYATGVLTAVRLEQGPPVLLRTGATTRAA